MYTVEKSQTNGISMMCVIVRSDQHLISFSLRDPFLRAHSGEKLNIILCSNLKKHIGECTRWRKVKEMEQTMLVKHVRHCEI